jgi:hypothetical protein
LSTPKWLDTSVESIGSLISQNGAISSNSALGELSWLSSLHSNLDGLRWAKKDISNELSACR